MAKKQPRTRKMYKGTYVQKKKPGIKAKSGDSIRIGSKQVRNKPREFLSEVQKRKLNKLIKEYDINCSSDQLKEILSKNRQIKTGTKTELLNRVAEGKLLGALPNCPKCMGGRIKFDIKSGEYYCKGFMDDDVFKNCNYKTLTCDRNEWQD